MNFTGNKVLIVVAHPDDEVIFFWWALQNPAWRCSLLCCSSDVNNPKRQKWAHRKNVLAGLCGKLGIEHRCLDYDSEFYKLDGRSGQVADFGRHVIDEVRKFDFDFICTHNRWGEYGKLDHCLIHYIVSCEFENVLVSNIFVPTEWSPHHGIIGAASHGFVERFSNNTDLYHDWEMHYRTGRAWTWNKDMVNECLVKQI
jgi:LmbE family N-acetylglucosaminyl deacetylase